MASNEYLKQTLEHYRQQKQTQLEALRRTEALIAHFEKEVGEAPTTGSENQIQIDYGSTLDYGNVVDTRPESRSPDVRPDEFFGMTQSDAAKAYLRRIKRAVSLDQIVEALNNGGAQVGGADPKKTLYVSLARNPKHEFVIPKEGYFGLREFYPSLPKAASKPKSGRRGKRSVKKKYISRHEQTTTVPRQPEKPIKGAVKKALVDGRALSLEEIVESVEQQLGRRVAKLGVGATLRGKEFVKEGDQYRTR